MSETPIPLLDLSRIDPEMEAELHEVFGRVLRSGRFIMGPEVESFERECAAYLQVRHAVGVSSGTDALLVALMALGVGPGDEVVCPTYTFFASAGSIWRLGARPVFVDSDPRCFTLDPAAVARRTTSRTKAIMPVHLFGQSAEMEPLLDLTKSRGIPLVEDAAQAIGAEYRGRRAGGMGALGCFSFFPSKNLGGFGDAGLVVTDDDALADRVRVLRTHGSRPKYHHAVVGGNFRIDALQAALLRVKLRQLDAATAARQRNAALYDRLLVEAGVVGPGGWLELPAVRQSRHIFNQYVIRVRPAGARDALQTFLTTHRVGTEVYYPVPMHLQLCFGSLGHTEGELPIAEAAARETLAIPIFPELREDEIRRVVAHIGAFRARAA